jgi:hypothetical protein
MQKLTAMYALHLLTAASLVLISGLSLGPSACEAAERDYSLSIAFVPDTDFTAEALSRRANELLSKESVKFIRVWYFSSKADANAFFPPRLVHGGYDHWRKIYDTIKPLRIPVAELIANGNSAILLTRSKDGLITRNILKGLDPLTVEVGGATLHILDYAFTPVRAQSNETRVLVYAWTTAPLTKELGAMAFEALAGSLPFPEAILSLRHDPWFIHDYAFPVFSPFSSALEPPTKEQYSKSPTLGCLKRATGELTCSVSDFHQ